MAKVLKLQLASNDFRRVQLGSMKWEDVRALLEESYGSLMSRHALAYEDADGDTCIITSEPEWKLYLEEHQADAVLRLALRRARVTAESERRRDTPKAAPAPAPAAAAEEKPKGDLFDAIASAASAFEACALKEGDPASGCSRLTESLCEAAKAFGIDLSLQPDAAQAHDDAADEEVKCVALDSTLRKDIFDALMKLLPGSKFPKAETPLWLKRCSMLRRNADSPQCGVLVVDVGQLLQIANERAYRLLDDAGNAARINHSMLFLQLALAIDPSNRTALYNSACAESIRGNLNSALDYFALSLSNGFCQIETALSDEDFANIRNSPPHWARFRQLVGLTTDADEPVAEAVHAPQMEPVAVVDDSAAEEPAEQPNDPSFLLMVPRWHIEMRFLYEMGLAKADNVATVLEVLDKYSGRLNPAVAALLRK